MDAHLHFIAIPTGFLVLPIGGRRGRCCFCTRGAHTGRRPAGRRGRHGRHFSGCRGRRGFSGWRRSSPPRRRTPPTSADQRPVHSRPSPGITPASSSLLETRSPDQVPGLRPVADRPPTPAPPGFGRLDPARTDLDDHIPDLRLVADPSLGLSPPDHGGSGLARTTTGLHPSFTIGTMVAHTGAPPFFRNNAGAGGPPSASLTTNPAAGCPAPSPLGRVGVVDRRPSIRRGTWSPASLGLFSGGN